MLLRCMDRLLHILYTSIPTIYSKANDAVHVTFLDHGPLNFHTRIFDGMTNTIVLQSYISAIYWRINPFNAWQICGKTEGTVTSKAGNHLFYSVFFIIIRFKYISFQTKPKLVSLKGNTRSVLEHAFVLIVHVWLPDTHYINIVMYFPTFVFLGLG